MTIAFTIPLAALMLFAAALPAGAAEEFKDEFPYRGGQCKYEFKADDSVEEKWECKYRESGARKVEHKRDHAYRGGTCKHEFKADQGKVEEKADCKYPLRGGSARAAPRELPPWVGRAPDDAEPPVIARGRCNREQLGRIIGGAAGAAIGSQIGDGTERKIAIVGGAVIGAIVGGRIGRNMDEADQACVGQVLETGRVGREVVWDSPQTGDRFSVTPTRDYRNSRGERCREYVAGTAQEQSRGAACRQADRVWRAVE